MTARSCWSSRRACRWATANASSCRPGWSATRIPTPTVEDTAIKELEEETGFTAERIEVLGEFFSSPGMVAEGFTLVRAHGLRRIGEGGGNEHEEIEVHLVAARRHSGLCRAQAGRRLCDRRQAAAAPRRGHPRLTHFIDPVRRLSKWLRPVQRAAARARRKFSILGGVSVEESCFWAARPPSRLLPLLRRLRRSQPTAGAATAVVPDNILLKDWTGPYDGVPPWDQVKPELFPQAFQFGIDELLARNRRDRQQSGGSRPSPIPSRRWRSRAERLDQVQVDLRRDDRQYVDARRTRRSTRNGRPSCRRPTTRSISTAKLFARIATLYEQRDQLGLDAKQMRLLTRTYEGFVRRGAKLNDAQKAQLSDYNQQLAVAFSDFNSQAAGRRSRPSPRRARPTWPAFRHDVKDAAAAAAKDQGPAGRHLRHPQHPLGGRAGAELRHQPRASREGVEGVRQSRRQWQCQRQQRDHRQDREAARRPRQAARLCDPRRLADAGHDGQVAGQGDGPDDAGVEAGGRAGP